MNRKLILSLTMVTLVIMACSKSDDDAKPTTSESLSDKAASAVSTMKETSSKVAGETMVKAKSAAEEASTFVKKGSSQVVTDVEDAKEGLANTVETVKEKAADMMSDTSTVEEKATDMMADSVATGPVTESQSVDADVDKSAAAATATVAGSLEAGKKALDDKMSVETMTEKTVKAPASTVDLEAGKSVYMGKCAVCHGSGAAGAPKLDDPSWSARNAQGLEILIDHALKGYKGSTGYMPAKGGFMALSDEEVKNAVAYMADTSRK